MRHTFLFSLLLGLGLLWPPSRAESGRHLNTAVLDSLRHERTARYADPESPAEQFLSQIWAEGMKWLNEHVFRKATRGFWEGLGYLIVILFSGYLVHLLLSGRLHIPLAANRAAPAPDVPAVNDPEKIGTDELGTLLQQAIRDGNWPFAVHILYVGLLKHLIAQKRISWHAAKTNHDYIRELNAPELKEAFTRITQNFEDVWYGARPVDEKGFRDFEKGCRRLEHETEQAGV